MSKAVMISIRPKWCEKIVNGEKTIEVRKTRPKLETPFKCYIYETQGRTDTPWVDKDGHMILPEEGRLSASLYVIVSRPCIMFARMIGRG